MVAENNLIWMKQLSNDMCEDELPMMVWCRTCHI